MDIADDGRCRRQSAQQTCSKVEQGIKQQSVFIYKQQDEIIFFHTIIKTNNQFCHLRCSNFVEIQYFTYAKSSDEWSPDICCYCSNAEDLLTVDQTKDIFDCGWKQQLRLCEACANLRITPPMKKSTTSFVETSKQQKASEKRMNEKLQAIRGKKTRKQKVIS